MSGPCYQDLVEKWRDAADTLERELRRLEKIMPPNKVLLNRREKEIVIQYVQGNAIISTIRTCANELEIEHDQ